MVWCLDLSSLSVQVSFRSNHGLLLKPAFTDAKRKNWIFQDLSQHGATACLVLTCSHQPVRRVRAVETGEKTWGMWPPESPHTQAPTHVAAAVRKLIPKAGPDPNQMKLPICLSTQKFAECPTSQLSICAADNGHCYRWSASWFTANICETQIKSTLGWKMPLHKCPGELNQGAE